MLVLPHPLHRFNEKVAKEQRIRAGLQFNGAHKHVKPVAQWKAEKITCIKVSACVREQRRRPNPECKEKRSLNDEGEKSTHKSFVVSN